MSELIQQADFIDYVLTSGTGKLTAAKRIKEGVSGRTVDFYKTIRAGIVDMHVKGVDTTSLDDLLATLVDPREKRMFPKVVNGYKKFLREGKMVWFEPPMRDYPLGPLSVRVAPEVGLLIDGRPHAIKLYFRDDPITPGRVVVTNQLMANALSMTWPGTVFAVLDVRRARLYPYYGGGAQTGLLLKAEAAHLSLLLAAL